MVREGRYPFWSRIDYRAVHEMNRRITRDGLRATIEAFQRGEIACKVRERLVRVGP